MDDDKPSRSILPAEKTHERYAREFFPMAEGWVITCRKEDEADMAAAFAAHGLKPRINGI